ncbi:hypothetical protein ACR777_12085 [Sphingobacterium spiritivorum]|uniref:hypothetical protein n=1 Tax=Sphingobacterium spiritivorum TaxID=258 RepID=UPI003DA35D90
MPKTKQTHDQVFPAILFRKIFMFHTYRIDIGYSAYECSFLLGKHDFFIRDAENPLKTTHIDPVDSNYLACIFGESIEKFTPDVTKQDNYQLKISISQTENRKTSFQILIRNEQLSNSNPFTLIEEEKLCVLPTAQFLSTLDKVKDFILHLLNNGYFDNTRTALDIYNEYRRNEDFGANFHVRNLIKSLNHFTNKKSGQALLNNERTNLFSRRLYFKPFNFEIKDNSTVSDLFLSNGIADFASAVKWVIQLPYKRNTDKSDSSILFREFAGTCSTKHAVLKRLADENGHNQIRLMLGIFMMDKKNTPAVAAVLNKYRLEYIPEAHNYLRIHNYIVDATGIGVNETKFELDLLTEVDISADQITDYKTDFHRRYLTEWLAQNNIPYSIEDIWYIREECIKALAEQ